MPTPGSRARAWLVTGAIAVGAAVGAAGIAGAATSGSSNATNPPANAPDPSKVANGPGEKLLTGTTADKVRAAALAAAPGSSVIRVETDSEGSPYEAHLKKADGTFVTVKVDKNFAVTKTESGFGGPGPGGRPPANGQRPPTGQVPPSSTN